MDDQSNNKNETPFFLIKGDKLQILATEFENGLMVAISEKDKNKLGTMALSVPMESKTGIPDRRGLTSTTIFGTRNEITTKALAEKITQRLQKIVYFSMNIKENDEELFNEALLLVESLFESILEKNE